MANQVDVKAVITAEDRASGVLSKFSSSLDSAKGASFALLGGLTAVAAGAALTVKAFAESENVAAQLDAVLKSTAGAAGVTRDAALDLSKSLQSTTTFSDEAVLSAENLLLTFTSIGKDIFPQATSTVLDMATALGEDTKSASIQLGKALQDPILGVTALRRVGVNFSQDQQDVIKNLVETGRQAEAQKLILAELNKEFGGSATAAAKTFTGQLKQLWNMINDVMEIIGKIIADQLRPFTQYLMNMFAAMGGADGVGKRLIDFLKELEPYIPIIAGALLGGLVPALWAMAGALGAAAIDLAPFVLVGAALAGIFKLIVDNLGGWDNALKTVKLPLMEFAEILKGIVKPALDNIVAIFRDSIIPFFEKHKEQIKFLAEVVLVAFAGAIIIVVGALAILAEAIVKGINQVIKLITWFENLKGNIERASGSVQGIIGWFQALPGVVAQATSGAGGFILNMLGPLGTVLRTLGQIVGYFNSLANIKSLDGVKGALHSLHVPGFADGVQNFSGGLAIVGERGPELVNLPAGAGVTPAPQTAQMLGGGQTVVNVTFSGVFNSNPADMRELAKKVFQAASDSAGQKNMTIGEMYS